MKMYEPIHVSVMELFKIIFFNLASKILQNIAFYFSASSPEKLCYALL